MQGQWGFTGPLIPLCSSGRWEFRVSWCSVKSLGCHSLTKQPSAEEKRRNERGRWVADKAQPAILLLTWSRDYSKSVPPTHLPGHETSSRVKSPKARSLLLHQHPPLTYFITNLHRQITNHQPAKCRRNHLSTFSIWSFASLPCARAACLWSTKPKPPNGLFPAYLAQ